MQLLLRQLGDMLASAVPTAIVVFLFYLVLRWSFFTPIARVMKERASRIEGAKREAVSLQAEAEGKRRAHQEGLRKARTQIFAEQEVARRGALDERAAAIQQARSRANEEVHAGRTRIGAELEAARGELDGAGKQLAEEIVRSILHRPQPNNSPAGGVQ
jgi:F0F1-type ATP synthase membrane subunit b/b'